MPLTPGTRIGPYEILAPLGAGAKRTGGAGPYPQLCSISLPEAGIAGWAARHNDVGQPFRVEADLL